MRFPFRLLRRVVCLTALGGGLSAGHPAVVRSEAVNPDAPYPESHASTIAELPGGGLVAAWFGGTKEKNPDVCIWVSRFENGAWTPAANVASGIVPGGARHPAWNPVLFQPPGADSPLFLFYKVGPNPREWWGMKMISRDGGRTWGEPERLPDGILGPVKNKPVILADGAWISPSSTESKTAWRVHFEISRDGGKTWVKTASVPQGGAKFDAIQPAVLTLPGGKLAALCRTRQGVVAMTFSDDNGRTWLPLAATALPNPNSGIDAVTLKDGRQLLVYNPSAHRPGKSSGPRYPLALALSADGLDWRRVAVLEAAPLPEGYAYPAVIQTADGLVHITHTVDRKFIKHTVVDPSRL
ncbi:MAG: exo-alpha-sialidase [Opitutaceae bacterium]|jgi:predicted neuraminidase|nr:exo-alpha-sialidase [Opitutaceae bacterium]